MLYEPEDNFNNDSDNNNDLISNDNVLFTIIVELAYT